MAYRDKIWSSKLNKDVHIFDTEYDIDPRFAGKTVAIRYPTDDLRNSKTAMVIVPLTGSDYVPFQRYEEPGVIIKVPVTEMNARAGTVLGTISGENIEKLEMGVSGQLITTKYPTEEAGDIQVILGKPVGREMLPPGTKIIPIKMDGIGSWTFAGIVIISIVLAYIAGKVHSIWTGTNANKAKELALEEAAMGATSTIIRDLPEDISNPPDGIPDITRTDFENGGQYIFSTGTPDGRDFMLEHYGNPHYHCINIGWTPQEYIDLQKTDNMGDGGTDWETYLKWGIGGILLLGGGFLLIKALSGGKDK